MDNYEQEKAEYEADLIDAQDRYFSARPQLSRTIHEEKIFESGFRMARENPQELVIPQPQPERRP